MEKVVEEVEVKEAEKLGAHLGMKVNKNLN